MTRQPAVARRAEALLGTAVVATAPAAGGDISTATKLRLSDGTTALMKTHPHAPPEFFEVEAAGLRWLAEAHEAGGVHVRPLIARIAKFTKCWCRAPGFAGIRRNPPGHLAIAS